MPHLPAFLVRVSILLAVLFLSGCATVKYTVDDGTAVDEKLLANIRLFGQAEKMVRPAVLRSAALQDKECDKQWELPIAVASSESWKEGAERVAWVRALQVDERLTVIATSPGVNLVPGDKIVDIEGVKRQEAEGMIRVLERWRDKGKPFIVKTNTGKASRIVPVEVCRGHVLPAPPGVPAAQDYHWLMTVHPLEVFREPLTPDEALWLVLWTQGISEEAGARMKTYHYGKRTLTTLLTLASVATIATSAAAGAAAGQAVASQAAQGVAEHLLDAAAQSAVEREKNAEAMAAANRSALSGVSWVAGTSFEKADKWAFERMARLDADPLAGVSLHGKLVRQLAARNAFVFDKERLPLMRSLVAGLGREGQLASLLNGVPLPGKVVAATRHEFIPLTLEDMSMASEEVVRAPLDMASFPPESRGGFLDSLALPRVTE